MRIAALIFGLLGVAGSGFLGANWLWDIETRRNELERIVKRLEAANNPVANAKVEELTKIIRSTYGLIGAAVLGLAATALVVVRKGKIAAILFLVAFAVPLALTKDVRIALFTFGLFFAGVLSFFVKPRLMAPVGNRPLDPV